MANEQITFEQWFEELKSFAKNENLPVSETDPESYRTFFNDGYTPSGAIYEDLSNT